MEDAFGLVVIGVSLAGIVVAAIALAATGRTYDQIGRGGLSIGEDSRPERAGELREEVRDLVEARNRRRVARGQEPLDVEAEVSRRLGEPGGG